MNPGQLKSSNKLVKSLAIVYRDLNLNPNNYALLIGVISPQIRNSAALTDTFLECQHIDHYQRIARERIWGAIWNKLPKP